MHDSGNGGYIHGRGEVEGLSGGTRGARRGTVINCGGNGLGSRSLG